MKLPPVPKTKKEVFQQGFVIVPPSEFSLHEERKYAKKVWKNYGVKNFYKIDHPWLTILKNVVDEIKPRNVLEFGCMVGRNLKYIQSLDSNITCVGLDINKEAVAFGKANYGLDLRVGNEHSLSSFKDCKFDLVFTVSVLDHIPFIETVCNELLRCARKAVFCLEISLPVEGKIVKLFDRKNKKVKTAIGATYSWHIAKYFKSDRIKECTIKNEDLGTLSGAYYKSYLFKL